MKRIYFLFSSFLLLLSLSIDAGVLTSEKSKDIALKGRYEETPTKSLPTMGSHPFIVSLTDDAIINIATTSPVTNVTASILKDDTIVDVYPFSLSAYDTESISLADYESGEYMLVLSTPRGTYLVGAFSL